MVSKVLKQILFRQDELGRYLYQHDEDIGQTSKKYKVLQKTSTQSVDNISKL